MESGHPTKPIEVWLTQSNLEVTCRIVNEDETVEFLDADSLSVRGAQREVTGWLISQGYKPVGRWKSEDDEGFECSRLFAPAEKSGAAKGAKD